MYPLPIAPHAGQVSASSMCWTERQTNSRADGAPGGSSPGHSGHAVPPAAPEKVGSERGDLGGTYRPRDLIESGKGGLMFLTTGFSEMSLNNLWQRSTTTHTRQSGTCLTCFLKVRFSRLQPPEARGRGGPQVRRQARCWGHSALTPPQGWGHQTTTRVSFIPHNSAPARLNTACRPSPGAGWAEGGGRPSPPQTGRVRRAALLCRSWTPTREGLCLLTNKLQSKGFGGDFL